MNLQKTLQKKIRILFIGNDLELRKLITEISFETILREGIFEGNILLAKTCCYNWSGRQDSNLRPSAPKATALNTQFIILKQSQLIQSNRKFQN